MTDDGVENAKQEGYAREISSAKVGTFKGFDDHGGQKDPTDDHASIKVIDCMDEDDIKAFVANNLDRAEVAHAKFDASEGLENNNDKDNITEDHIGVKAFVNEDEDGVKAIVDENLAFAIAKGDEVAHTKAETFKTPSPS
jgi:hypothetical protein